MKTINSKDEKSMMRESYEKDRFSSRRSYAPKAILFCILVIALLLSSAPLGSAVSMYLNQNRLIAYPTGNLGINSSTDVTAAISTGSLYLIAPNSNKGIGFDIDEIQSWGGTLFLQYDSAQDLDVGNSDLFVETGAGLVGINTTSPAYALTVDGVTRFRQAGGTTNRSDHFVSGGNVYINAYNDAGTGAYIPMYIDASTTILGRQGNVGIGTTAPGYKLDVNGDMNLAAGSVYRIGGVAQSASSKWTAGTGDNIYRNTPTGNVSIGSTDSMARLYARTAGAKAIYGSSSAGAGTNYGGYFEAIGGAASAPGPTNYAGYFDAHGGIATNWAIYAAAGNAYFAEKVGIGTTSPGAKLDVVGGSRFLSAVGGSGLAIDVSGAQTANGFSGVTLYQLYDGGVGGSTLDSRLGNWDGEFRWSVTTATGNKRLMTIRGANGNVGIGTTTPTTKLDITNSASGTSFTFNPDLSASGYTTAFTMDGTGFKIAGNSGSRDIRIVANSAGVVLAANGNSWGAISDERLKNVIAPLDDGADKLMSLRTVYYKYKADDSDVRRIGLIAQDVQKVLPEAVSADNDGYLSLRYNDLIPPIIKAIQEQQKQIDELKAENEQLKARLEKVE